MTIDCYFLNTPCKILHANLFSICLLVVYSFCILNNNIIPAWSPQRYANQLRLTTWKISESSFLFPLSLPLSLTNALFLRSVEIMLLTRDLFVKHIIVTFFLSYPIKWSKTISCWYVVHHKRKKVSTEVGD